MKPWDYNAGEMGDPELWELWKTFTPHDFYFGIMENRATDTTLVFITPSDYYDQFGLMLDDSMPIGHLIPEHLEEIMTSVFETGRMVETTRYDMMDRGFINDPHFQQFIDCSDWFSSSEI